MNDLSWRQNQNMVNASCLQPDTCADSRNRVNDCNVPYNKQREELYFSSWMSCECEQDVPKRTCAHPHILRFPGAFDRLGRSAGFENGNHEIHSDRDKIIQLAEALGMHLLITCNPLDILRIFGYSSILASFLTLSACLPQLEQRASSSDARHD